MGIQEIKNLLKEASIEELRELICQFETDERAGVIKLVESARKRITAFEAEVDAALSTSNALTVIEFEY